MASGTHRSADAVRMRMRRYEYQFGPHEVRTRAILAACAEARLALDVLRAAVAAMKPTD